MSLTVDKREKHTIVTGPEAPCILGRDYLRRRYFRDPKEYRWAFGLATVNTKIKALSTLPGLSEDPFVVAFAAQEEAEHQAVRTLHAICILFISIIVVIFFSLCHPVKLLLSQPMSFAFSLCFSSPSHKGEGRSERATAWFFVAN